MFSGASIWNNIYFSRACQFYLQYSFLWWFMADESKLPPLFEISHLDASSNLRDGVLRRYMI